MPNPSAAAAPATPPGEDGEVMIPVTDYEDQLYPHQTPASSSGTSSSTRRNNSTLLLFFNGDEAKTLTNRRYVSLLVINYLMLFAGSLSSSLLAKFYFNHKGSSRWVSTWVQAAGFPLLIPAVYLPFHLGLTARRPFAGFTRGLLALCGLIGLMLGLSNFLFSWGTSYLPVSTSSLLLSTQLAFTLFLSALIVNQKVTFMNLNCVVLLTMSSVLLGITSSHDRPDGLTRTNYFVGFFCTLGAGLLFALYLPVMEKLYRRLYCYEMVVEMQLIMEAVATVAATAGMAANGGFEEMMREATTSFDLGPKWYWLTIAGNMVVWQLSFMGTAGMVFLTTSLTGGICMTALLAMNVLGGVLVYGDNFEGPKVVSTLLCAWAFLSYVYGMYTRMKKRTEHQLNNKDKNNKSVNVPQQQQGKGQGPYN